MPFHSYTVDRPEGGQTLAVWLQQRLDLPAARVRQLVQSRQVRVAGMACNDPQRRLRPGQRIDVPLQESSRRSSAGRARSPSAFLDSLPVAPTLRHVDEQIVVVEKPAGLTTMRHPEDIAEQGPKARRYLPPTLADLVPVLLARAHARKHQAVRAVHRLDNETTGLVVFARTVEAEKGLSKQFRDHSVERRYLALVRGRARPGRIESDLVRDRGDGRRGSKPGDQSSQHAVTEVTVVEELAAFTLVQCKLETGRTHQVRIHLGEAGTPLCGERVYDRSLDGRPLPETSGAIRVMLHAATLGLEHPTTGKRLHWTSHLPPDMRNLLKRLRRQAQERSSSP